MLPQEDFSALIAALESTGLSRTEIAERAGVSRNTVWRMANGEARAPSYSTVTRLKGLSPPVRHIEQKKR